MIEVDEMRKRKWGIFLIGLFVMVISFISVAVGTEYYPVNFIKKIKMPGKALEELAIHTENKCLYQFSKFMMNDNQDIFSFEIQNYIIKSEYLKNNDRVEYSGKWTIINKETEIEGVIQLKSDSLIIMCKDDYILARNENQLLYIPVNDGQIQTQQEEQIYIFTEMYMEELERLKKDWGVF